MGSAVLAHKLKEIAMSEIGFGDWVLVSEKSLIPLIPPEATMSVKSRVITRRYRVIGEDGDFFLIELDGQSKGFPVLKKDAMKA